MLFIVINLFIYIHIIMENQKETNITKQEQIAPVKQDLAELIREAKQEKFNEDYQKQVDHNKSQIRK